MKSDIRLIRLIAAFKLLKAILLVAVAAAAFKLVHTNITDALTERVARLGLDPGGRYVGRLILKSVTLTPDKIRDVGIGCLIYAGLFLTEGVGLWLVKRWAEWFSPRRISASIRPISSISSSLTSAIGVGQMMKVIGVASWITSLPPSNSG